MKNLIILSAILLCSTLSAQHSCKYETLETNSEGNYVKRTTSPARIFTSMTSYNVSSIKLSLCREINSYSLRFWFNSNKKVSFHADQRLIISTSDGGQYILKLIPDKSNSEKWNVLMMQYTNYYYLSASDLRQLAGKEITGFTIPHAEGVFNVDLTSLNPFKDLAVNYFAETANCVFK